VIRSKYLSLVVAVALAGAACGKTANTNTTTNSNAASANANANVNAAPPADTASANYAGNPAGSPTEVYKAAYTARNNCDVDGLKKVMSKDILKFLTDMGKDEKKSLEDQLKEICKEPQASTAQARNEKINGDRATIEYLDEDGQWRPMEFIREDGVWKMSIGKQDMNDPDKKKADKDNRS